MVNERNANINLKNFPKFEIEDDFITFKERKENVFEVLDTDEDQKSGILIAVLGPKIYKILKNLCNPDIPKTKTYANLITLLEGQFVPKVAIYKERRIFFEANQFQGESIIDWQLRIKRLSCDCEFGANLDRIIKDRFICGLSDKKIFERICEEELSQSYETILKIALRKEVFVERN